MKPSTRTSKFRAALDIAAAAATVLGAIAAYIGFTFDFNSILAAGALAATSGICYFMNPKN